MDSGSESEANRSRCCPGSPPPGKVALPPPVKQGPIDKYEGKKFLFMRHGEGSAEHKNGMVYQGRWFLGKWSGEGELRLPGKWTYRGRFRNGLLSGKGTLELDNGAVFDGKFRTSEPRGKGVLHYKEEFRFEGRWSNAETATGKVYGLEQGEMKARIRGGEIQTMKGMLSKWKPAGSFDCGKVLSEGKIG